MTAHQQGSFKRSGYNGECIEFGSRVRMVKPLKKGSKMTSESESAQLVVSYCPFPMKQII